MTTAGEKRNNPGCIMGKDGLRQYTTLEDGYAALNSLLYRKYNNRTCYDIFCQYAPYSDGNNPRKYADFVINELNKKGISVTDSTVLDLSNPYILQELTLAISKMENGKVLGGETFARNCSVAFAYEKGLSNTTPNQIAQETKSPIQRQEQPNPTEILVQQNLDQTENPDLIENLKKNQAKAEQKLAKNDKSNEKESNSNIIKLLIQATAALLTKNSALSNTISTIVENTLTDDTNNNVASINKKDNQNV